ncbi:MAG: hypothetical protein AB1599_00580 [Planctomycetota bacterium]
MGIKWWLDENAEERIGTYIERIVEAKDAISRGELNPDRWDAAKEGAKDSKYGKLTPKEIAEIEKHLGGGVGRRS